MPTIERSALRQTLDHLIFEDRLTRGIKVFDDVAKIPGIQIEMVRDPGWDSEENYNCAEYVFRTIMREDWAIPKAPDEFWLHTHKFLRDKGYRLVKTPEPGDVVGYTVDSLFSTLTTGDPTPAELTYIEEKQALMESPYFVHFGILRGDHVVSKFANGYIFRHPINLIPNAYGDRAHFFRKSS